MTPKIAILSGSSQVAFSVAIYLSYFKKAEITALSRDSKYSEPIYRLVGIVNKTIPTNLEVLKLTLEEFDIIIDFSLPKSEFWDNKKILGEHYSNLFKCLPKDIPFIAISTQNAYGFRESDKYIRSRLTDWSSPYCSLKRFGEKKVLNLGKKYNVPTYNIRLGQVHGFLQSVSHRFCSDISDRSSIYIDGKGDDFTNILFISDIGESVLEILSRRWSSGTYSLISLPQWTQKDLYDYYIKWCNVKTKVNFIGSIKKSRINLVGYLFNILIKHRGFIDVVILQNLPFVARKAKARHRINMFRSKIKDPKVVFNNLLGTPSLNIISNGTNSLPIEVYRDEKIMYEMYINAIKSKVLFSKF